MTAAQREYIRRETAISTAINAALSVFFFLLVFRLHGPIAVAGFGNYAFDFVPQSFAIAFMATLVPGVITAARLRAGAVAPLAATSRLSCGLLPRALTIAAIGVAIGLVPAIVLRLAAGDAVLARAPALVAKVVYGALLALVVTPPGLRAALAGGMGAAR